MNAFDGLSCDLGTLARLSSAKSRSISPENLTGGKGQAGMAETGTGANCARDLCGTGTEDYFCGAFNWDVGGKYIEYCTPYAGMFQVLRPDGTYQSQHRHAMYRWHIPDPVRFEQDIRVTIQALGWRSGGRYLPLQDDISSVAYWYQTLPTAPFPALPDKDYLEII